MFERRNYFLNTITKTYIQYNLHAELTYTHTIITQSYYVDTCILTIQTNIHAYTHIQISVRPAKLTYEDESVRSSTKSPSASIATMGSETSICWELSGGNDNVMLEGGASKLNGMCTVIILASSVSFPQLQQLK